MYRRATPPPTSSSFSLKREADDAVMVSTQEQHWFCVTTQLPHCCDEAELFVFSFLFASPRFLGIKYIWNKGFEKKVSEISLYVPTKWRKIHVICMQCIQSDMCGVFSNNWLFMKFTKFNIAASYNKLQPTHKYLYTSVNLTDIESHYFWRIWTFFISIITLNWH